MGYLPTTPNPYALGSDYMNNLIAQRKAKAQPLASTIADLEKPFAESLASAITNPGLKDKEVESIINKGTDEISAGQEAASLQLGRASAAAGAGKLSGSAAKANRLLATDYAGQKANLARDVRTNAAQSREQLRLGALDIASRPVLQEDQQAFVQQHDPRLTAAGYEAGAGFGIPGLPKSNGQELAAMPGSGSNQFFGRGGASQLGGRLQVLGGGTGVVSSTKKGPGITHYTGATPFGEGTFMQTKNGILQLGK